MVQIVKRQFVQVRANQGGIIPDRWLSLESYQTDTESRGKKDTLQHGINEYELNGGPAINGSVDVVYTTVDGFDAMEVSSPLAFHDRTDVSERICVPDDGASRTIHVPAEFRTVVSEGSKGKCD